MMTLLTDTQRDRLIAAAERADRQSDWPSASWQVLQEAGALGASIPPDFGGTGKDAVELLCGLEEISQCCLTTAFALSQREAAVRQLLKGPGHLQQRYLPRLASGKFFMTVGLSQLTTSRQHLGPALRATPLPTGGYQLDGEIPWVTGADQAAAIVVGATLPDATQLLLVLPQEALTEPIAPPLELAALEGSRTSLIRCEGVTVIAESILAGPAESVLGKIGGGGLETSCLAIGLAAAAIGFIRQESQSRADLMAIADRLEVTLHSTRARLHELAVTASEPQQTLALRLDSTKLALRATQAALMVAKGMGFVSPHPTQRWARQAMFFLVWSCPRPVSEGLLTALTEW